ncbi:MAG: SNF2 helicase associated domain-containing protein [Myxococcales bacterium]|nr:SNF2 helicase associated domain-containing protein [Myxococcales bacterium]MCB9630460.1 SNF2 helicase associated domain-containing protein [Sandaracinaceae bacterium]
MNDDNLDDNDEDQDDDRLNVPFDELPFVAQRVSKMSDRAIQRVTGGNAFLRGRLYARRKSVEDLVTDGATVTGEINVRSSDEPYTTSATVSEDDVWSSHCTCPGWRGADGHCKHVAAIMVALRDQVRPPKTKDAQGGDGESDGDGDGDTSSNGNGNGKKKKKKKPKEPKAELVHVPQTVSVGGTKRRRSRRRRRGTAADGKIEVLSARDLQGPLGESRGLFDLWLPPEALQRPYEFEYRMAVRPTSFVVTPVITGTRRSAPIIEALEAFNMVTSADRPLFRALARHANRSQPATAEIRGEDASEVLSMLRGRRVLLEPASMELRFSTEVLKPRVELDRANADHMRVKVAFALDNGRRFPIGSGSWFEGTPGWHIDVTDGTARPLADSVSPAMLTRLRQQSALVHPNDDLPRLLTDFIPRVAMVLGSELPDLSSAADLVDESAQIRMKAHGDIVNAQVKFDVIYGQQTFEVPSIGLPPPLAFLAPKKPGGRPRIVRRDVGLELTAIQHLTNMGFEPDDDGEYMEAVGDEAVTFWTQGVAQLPAEWDKLIPEGLRAIKIRKEAVQPRMSVSSGVDWLSLDMVFGAGKLVVAEDELLACLESGRKLVKLEDGSYAPVDVDEVGDILARMAEITLGPDAGKIPLSQAGRINDLMKLVPNAKVSTSAKELFAKLHNIDEIPSIPKPRTLKATLRPYQKLGFSWLVFLHELGSGGILADDMGLGKTLQTIGLLAWAKGQLDDKLSLVVAPTSVVPNWEREIRKFAPSLETVVWQGSDRHERRDMLQKADVLITSYALLRRDEEFLQSLDLRYVILDEAQHIKNPLSQTARAAKKLASERRLALTGTPIENRLSELWSIFDFVSPGLLGQLKTFEEKVARPIDRGDDETARKLRNTIQPFVLRRLKKDVALDLPEKIEQEIVVPLADSQQGLYKQILEQVRKSVLSEVESKGVAKAHIQILAALTRLRQVACDPRLMKLEDQEFTDADSGKLGALREIISEAVAGDHRVLVFSQFVQMLQLIRAALDADGVRYEYLDGSTQDRMDRVDRFNADGDVPVFLISLKAGGTGLNLTGADTVVHFDPWWNPAVEDQATDRAHRIGQDKVVTVYRLIAAGTVEEKILDLSEKKRALVSNVLSSEGSPLKGLTKADVESLFSD